MLLTLPVSVATLLPLLAAAPMLIFCGTLRNVDATVSLHLLLARVVSAGAKIVAHAESNALETRDLTQLEQPVYVLTPNLQTIVAPIVYGMNLPANATALLPQLPASPTSFGVPSDAHACAI